MTARVIELGRLRELRPRGSLASLTSITWKGTRSSFLIDQFHLSGADSSEEANPILLLPTIAPFQIVPMSLVM